MKSKTISKTIERDKLQNQLIEREMLLGKDVSITVKSIQSIGILKTLVENPTLPIKKKGIVSAEAFVAIYLKDYSYPNTSDFLESLKQKALIKLLNEGCPVTIFLKNTFNAAQVLQIQRGLDLGVEVDWFADPAYSSDQMEKILNGLIEGVDVSKYANTSFSDYIMESILKGLKTGIDLSSFVYFGESNLNFILNQRNFGYGEKETIYFLEKGFCQEQIKVLQLALREGNDISLFENTQFSPAQMSCILFCQGQGIDASVFADPGYLHSEMLYISSQLKKGISLKGVINPEMDIEEIKEIAEVLSGERSVTPIFNVLKDVPLDSF